MTEQKSALVVGGANGLGLALTIELLKKYDKVYVADRCEPEFENECLKYIQVNLLDTDFSFLEQCKEVSSLYYTAGFGRISPWEKMQQNEIENQFKVNVVSAIRTINYFSQKLTIGGGNFNCCVIGSIAGLVSSPLFALYAATKAAVWRYIESVNVELEATGSSNRILCVSPGSIKGTRFNGGQNDITLVNELAKEIIIRAERHETLYIPDYDTIYKGVMEKYHVDPHRFGLDSYEYKTKSGRSNSKPQIKVGYLSGTFDLFHVGHLNLLRRAKQYCDYLVVGVHPDASHKGKTTAIPFEERMDIVRSCRYVDRVIQSEPEDVDVFRKGIVKYDYLFVGSDYKGTERFDRYEEYFADTDTKIVYFPYTTGTSSTMLRKFIAK